jgi:hypothetical protein
MTNGSSSKTRPARQAAVTPNTRQKPDARFTNVTEKTSGDATRTQRAERYLQKLEDQNGKRMVIDLREDHVHMLQALIEARYGENQSEVVRRAIAQAYASDQEKPTGKKL